MNVVVQRGPVFFSRKGAGKGAAGQGKAGAHGGFPCRCDLPSMTNYRAPQLVTD
jgi:hypothetical protein